MRKFLRFPSKRRKLLLRAGWMTASLGSIAVAGCGSLTGSPAETQVRFVDASADAPALDLYLNGAGAAYNLGYATFSSYVPVSAGSYQVSANRASTLQALATERASLLAGKQYTAVVGSRLGDLREHIYPDAVPVTVPGTLAIRVLNEMEGGPVDVYLVANAGSLSSAVPLVTNLGYGANRGYLRLPANGSYVAYVVPAGSSPLTEGTVKVSGASVSGTSGAARTLILAESGAKDGRAVYGIVLEDAETT